MSTALLIVDHGSLKPEANEMLAKLVELVKGKRPDLIVKGAHMELAEPSIEQGIAQCVAEGATKIVVHPYMLWAGRHASEDIPRLAADAVSKYPDIEIRVTAPLGLDDKIGDVVLQRAGL